MASGLNKKEDPYNQHYCCVNFDGTGFQDLTPENANHKVILSRIEVISLMFTPVRIYRLSVFYVSWERKSYSHIRKV